MRIKITNPIYAKEIFRDQEFDVYDQTGTQYGVRAKHGNVWFWKQEVTVLEE